MCKGTEPYAQAITKVKGVCILGYHYRQHENSTVKQQPSTLHSAMLGVYIAVYTNNRKTKTTTGHGLIQECSGTYEDVYDGKEWKQFQARAY